jgi:MoaA/NifB/PqqE/SkfB family radical SAM enzyme
MSKISKKKKLDSLTLEITNECPLQCLHCSSSSPSDQKMLKGVVYRTISDAIEVHSIKKFCFSGGEPTLHPYLEHALRYINENIFQPKIRIFTCGIGVDVKPFPPEIINYISNHRENILVFSVHGRESIHDMITATPGSHKALMRSISDAIRRKITCEINFVPMNINFNEFQYVAGFAFGIGIERINILRFIPQGRGYENKSILQMTEEDENKFIKIVKDVQETKSVYIETRNFTEKSAYQPQPTKSIEIHTGTPCRELIPDIEKECRSGSGKLVIQADGNVIP